MQAIACAHRSDYLNIKHDSAFVSSRLTRVCEAVHGGGGRALSGMPLGAVRWQVGVSLPGGRPIGAAR